MNTLKTIRTNIYYIKKVQDDGTVTDEYQKVNELVFVIDKPSYRLSSEGRVIRERVIEDFRFTVDEESFDAFITFLLKIKEERESSLGA